MIRILWSRAALFPGLGLALMAAGAVCPANSVAGMVLVVVGANVAFYSLRDFSQNFGWGSDSRAMLTLCGLAFLAGLGLVVAATQFEARNHWLAFVCAGLYLCLFSIWTAQQPVGTAYRVLTFAGLMLMILGATFGYVVWPSWRVHLECKPDPQVLTLDDLIQKGHGDNRYVRITGFRFCDRQAAETDGKSKRIDVVWIPVVPIDGLDVKSDGPAPAVPPRLTAVAGYIPVGGRGGDILKAAGREPGDVRMRRTKEVDGYECTVVTGIRSLDPAVRDQLAEFAPQTDFDQVIVLDWRGPWSAERIYEWLAPSAAGFLLGLIAVLVVYVHAWKVVRAAGAARTDESAA